MCSMELHINISLCFISMLIVCYGTLIGSQENISLLPSNLISVFVHMISNQLLISVCFNVLKIVEIILRTAVAQKTVRQRRALSKYSLNMSEHMTLAKESVTTRKLKDLKIFFLKKEILIIITHMFIFWQKVFI